jgi:cyclohexyl-isocyanide hydratase
MSDATPEADYIVAIPIYQGVDLMDVTAPYEIFQWMADHWDTRTVPENMGKKNVQLYLLAENLSAVITRGDHHAGIQLNPQKTFDMVPHVDLLWIPGGDPNALVAQMGNSNYVRFIQSCSKTAQYVTSVCEGALIAANAGLLDGYTVTTHWQFMGCLKHYPLVKVHDGHPRYVQDRNRVTGGGISSGIDEALHLVQIVAGPATAKAVRDTIQYFPCSPIPGACPTSDTCFVQGLPVPPPPP